MKLPNIWGRGGALFAFSGFDGKTDVGHPFTASTSDVGRGLRFHAANHPAGLDFRYTGLDNPTFEDEVVVSDVISTVATFPGGKVRLRYVSLDSYSVIGDISWVEGKVTAGIEAWGPGYDNLADWEGDSLFYNYADEQFRLAASGKDVFKVRNGLFMNFDGGGVLKFAFTYSHEKPFSHNDKALDADVDSVIKQRLAFFDMLPEPKTGNPVLDHAYYKCASIQKVNACTAEGEIPFNWSTPDRWPHRIMWIWDSAYHSLGYRHYAPDWAVNSLKSVLSRLYPNGFIPHEITVYKEKDSDMVQPPVIGWAAWKLYETTGDSSHFEYCYPRLKEMLKYDSVSLDKDGSGLSEWEHAFASGMDNSPRFDVDLGDAIDLNSFIVNDLRYLAKIAEKLGHVDDVSMWNSLADEKAALINSMLWDEKEGAYYDRLKDGSVNRLKTASMFIPMFAGVCSDEQAKRLVAHLTNPEEFWRPFPVTTVSVDEPTFTRDLWRGCIWICYDYLIMEGLSRYGYDDIAEKIREAVLREISRVYAADGTVFEYYDGEAKMSPSELARKGRPCQELGVFESIRNIRDYHWSASLYIDLLLNGAPKCALK